MITEDYISFKTARLLKEKGFDEDCWSWYEDEDYAVESNDDYGYQSNTDHISKYFICSRPTLQMAMKWLREKHRLEIYPFHEAFQECNNWWYRIEKHTKGCNMSKFESDSIYLSYEQACEAAIKYCLENLI